MSLLKAFTANKENLGSDFYISPNIPPKKLTNAIAKIAGGEVKQNSVIAVIDNTVFGACDKGVLFTEKCLYFNDSDKKVIKINYSDLVSCSSKGVLVCKYPNGKEVKICVTSANAKKLAEILTKEISIINEEKAILKEWNAVSNDIIERELEKGKKEFDIARKKLLRNGIIFVVVGMFGFCLLLWLWSIPAIIAGIILLKKYNSDKNLYSSGLPVGIYEKDVSELITTAWIGVVVVLGVFFIPAVAKKSQERLVRFNTIISELKCKRINDFILSFSNDKTDTNRFLFARLLLYSFEQLGKVTLIDLNEKNYIFSTSYLNELLSSVKTLTKDKIKINRQDLLPNVKKMIFTDDNDDAEAFINLPNNELESYTFEDGAYYVNSINNDNIRICSSCGIAHVIDENCDKVEGEYFCSDFCRETDEICEKIISEKHKEKLIEAGIEGAAYGATVGQIVASLRDNMRSVGKTLVTRTDTVTGEVVQVQTGHGVAAEIANTRIDKLSGQDAQHLGNDNAIDGADRIVNGVEIQTKYCQTATASVDAGFKDGQYRYIGKDGTPMQLEVPRDQYSKAVELMQEKIKSGQVPGVTDPEQAEKIIRKGHLTYNQAMNTTKCCTIESLAYDAHTGTIVAASAFGVSFVITTALSLYKTKDLKKALQASLGISLQSGGKAFCVYVLSAQMQRLEFVKAFMSSSTLNINFGGHGKFVERIGRGLNKMSGANSGSFSKNANIAIKGAVVTAAATLAVSSAWQVTKMCNGNISGMQCIKNISIAAGGISGATVGALLLGALLAPIPGGVFIGGLIGGSLGGMIGSKTTQSVMDAHIQDDSVLVMQIVSDEFKIIAASYCMCNDEIKTATDELDKMICGHAHFIEDVFSKDGYRNQYVARLLKPIFLKICLERPLLLDSAISESSVENAIQNI